MNKQRRKQISELMQKVSDLKEELDEVLQEEQDYYDNMPENLQYSARGENSEEAICNLEEACSSLKMVEKSIEDGMPEDFYSIDLMNAYASLGRIIGEEVDDDLVEEIFSKFCMGK